MTFMARNSDKYFILKSIRSSSHDLKENNKSLSQFLIDSFHVCIEILSKIESGFMPDLVYRS